MTLLKLEGFDDYATSTTWPWLSIPGTADIRTTGGGRTGPGYLYNPTTTVPWYKVVDAPDEHALFCWGMAFKPQSNHAYDMIAFRSDNAATEHVVLRKTLTGDLAVDRGATQLAVTTVGNLITADVYHYVEMEALLSDTVGTVKVWVDGLLVINLSGVDTKNAGTKTVFDSIYYVGISSSGATNHMDDIYLSNGAGSLNVGRIGEMRVETKYVDGNGNYSQLLGSDGNSVDNYLNVDEQGAPLSADYNGSATNGQKDTYTVQDLSVGTATIYGVEVRMHAAKTDSGAKSIRRVHRRGGVDSVGADRALAMNYDLYNEVLQQDPNGPTAWTVANFNASEFGAEVRP